MDVPLDGGVAAPSPCRDSGPPRAWLQQHPDLYGWSSHVRGAFSADAESPNLSKRSLGSAIGHAGVGPFRGSSRFWMRILDKRFLVASRSEAAVLKHTVASTQPGRVSVRSVQVRQGSAFWVSTCSSRCFDLASTCSSHRHCFDVASSPFSLVSTSFRSSGPSAHAGPAARAWRRDALAWTLRLQSSP